MTSSVPLHIGKKSDSLDIYLLVSGAGMKMDNKCDEILGCFLCYLVHLGGWFILRCVFPAFTKEYFSFIHNLLC